MSGAGEQRPHRGDWVMLADGVRVSRTWMTRRTPHLLAAWCEATSHRERRAVGLRILQVAGGLGSRRDGSDPQATADRWRALAQRIDPRLVHGPAWPPLAAALGRAAAAGYDVACRLPALAAAAPLPDRHSARELHWRLLDDCPAALPDCCGAAEPSSPRGHVPADVHSRAAPPRVPTDPTAHRVDRGPSTRAPHDDEGDTMTLDATTDPLDYAAGLLDAVGADRAQVPAEIAVHCLAAAELLELAGARPAPRELVDGDVRMTLRVAMAALADLDEDTFLQPAVLDAARAARHALRRMG